MSEHSHTHSEHHEEASRGAALRNFVFGTSDGLVTVLAFVAGVSASLATRRLVLIAGLAEMFAGAVSMGLGAFLGTRAERDWYERERKREEMEVAKIPHLEREEPGYDPFVEDDTPARKRRRSGTAGSVEEFLALMMKVKSGGRRVDVDDARRRVAAQQIDE